MFTATAQRLGHTLKHEIDVNGRHTIATDEPVSLGGTDEGPAPHELLPAALAGCIATTVAIYAERHSWDIGEPSVSVDYDPEPVPRCISVSMELPDDLPEDQVKRLERVAEACPLRRALESGFAFDERLITTPRQTPV